MARFAKLVFESPLPALDRLFDYEVPVELVSDIRVGQRVLAPFGRSKQPLSGFVVGLSQTSEYAGQISQIAQIISPVQVLAEKQYSFIRQVADRAAVTFGDVAKSAIPDRMVRVESTWLASKRELSTIQTTKNKGEVKAYLSAPQVQLSDCGHLPGWMVDVLKICSAARDNFESVIVAVPDFRDVSRLYEVLSATETAEALINYESGQTKSDRYLSYLRCLEAGRKVVLGSRAAIYAPLANVDHIIVVDDASPSHQDQASPYTSTRDIALLRHEVSKATLHFVSSSRSLAVQRLVEIGYAREADSQSVRKNVVHTEEPGRQTALPLKIIRDAVKIGPVLVQVSNLGLSPAAYCKECGERARCKHCSGPLKVTAQSKLECRFCSGLNTQFLCVCGSTKLRQGRAGSARTAIELGKAVAGVRVVESTSNHAIETVPNKPLIVVATPGCEPIAEQGYAAVVIFDADVQLNRESLSAQEQALLTWASAISLADPSAAICICGVSNGLGQQLRSWKLRELASSQLAEFTSLGFPPSKRLVSIAGTATTVNAAKDQLQGRTELQFLGFAPNVAPNELCALYSYAYKDGSSVAAVMRALQLAHGSSTRSLKPGRTQRALTIKMDDSQIL